MDNILKYFSYGRDYFAKAAGRPQGALKKNWIDQDDLPRDGDIADDEVSDCHRSLDHFEKLCTYDSLPRTLFNAKNASRHFVTNPLLNFNTQHD